MTQIRCAALVALAVAAAPTAIATICTPALSHADACANSASNPEMEAVPDPCADVFAQEARWLTAITAGDVPTVESILAPNFMHTTSSGQLLSRAQEVASMTPVSYRMNPSDQLVEFFGDTAVVRGINTITDAGKVITRERYTDVFVKNGGTWLAVSAQESPIETTG
jgi:ketosteroid isomerase-like protein